MYLLLPGRGSARPHPRVGTQVGVGIRVGGGSRRGLGFGLGFGLGPWIAVTLSAFDGYYTLM